MKLLQKINGIKAIQIFQLFRFGAVFVTGIILAKKGFSTTDISQYETFLFITYAATFFWLSAITNSFLSLFPKEKENAKKELIFNTALTMFAFSFLSAILIVGLTFTQIFSVPYLFLITLFLLFNIPSYLSEYILLVNEKNNHLTIYGVVSFSAHVLIIVAALAINTQVTYVLFALVLIAILKFLYLLYLLVQHATFSFNSLQQQKLSSSSLPLAISYLLSGSSEVIDSFLVKKFYSESDFTIYRYGAKELPLVLLMANAFSSAAITKVADNLEEGLALIKQNSLKLLNTFFPVTIVLMFSSKYLFRYIFNFDFTASATIFNIYLLLLVSRLLFPQTILNGLGKNRFLVVSALIETILNIVLSLILMQQYGMAGIAMATVIAHLADKILLIAYCKFQLKIEPVQYIEVSQYIFYSGLLLIIFYLLSI